MKLNLEKADDNVIWEFLKYAIPRKDSHHGDNGLWDDSIC